jgi:hypothetical protein
MVMVIVGGAVTVAVAALEEAGAVPPQDVTAQTRPIKPANEIIDTHVPRIPISKTPRQSRDEEAGALVGCDWDNISEANRTACGSGWAAACVAAALCLLRIAATALGAGLRPSTDPPATAGGSVLRGWKLIARAGSRALAYSKIDHSRPSI